MEFIQTVWDFQILRIRNVSVSEQTDENDKYDQEAGDLWVQTQVAMDSAGRSEGYLAIIARYVAKLVWVKVHLSGGLDVTQSWRSLLDLEGSFHHQAECFTLEGMGTGLLARETPPGGSLMN